MRTFFRFLKQLLLTLVDECSAQDKYSFRSDVLGGMGDQLDLRAFLWDGFAAQLRIFQQGYLSLAVLDGAVHDKAQRLVQRHFDNVQKLVLVQVLVDAVQPRGGPEIDFFAVVADGGVNDAQIHKAVGGQAAFLGQFADTPRDTVFTTEYSVRTAMEAVYGLLGVDRGVPEVWGSVYDVRELLDSSVKLMDGMSPLEIELPGPLNALKKPLLRVVKGTVVEKLLRDHNVIKDGMLD